MAIILVTASAGLMMLVAQAVQEAPARTTDPRESAVRAKIAEWSQATSMAAYDLSISFLDEDRRRRPSTDKSTRSPLTELFSAKGTLDVMRDDILYFRFPVSGVEPEETPQKTPTGGLTVPSRPGANLLEEHNRQAYALLVAMGKVESNSVACFFKYGSRVALKTRYLHGIQPEWCGVTIDQVIGTIRDGMGRATAIQSSLFVLSVLDGIGTSSPKNDAVEHAVGVIDPRRLVSMKALDTMSIVDSSKSASAASTCTARIPVDGDVASGVSNLARHLEPNQKGPGERVEGQLEVSLDESLSIVRLQLRIDFYTPADLNKPGELDHYQELFVFVPKSIFDVHELPREVAELLAVDTGR